MLIHITSMYQYECHFYMYWHPQDPLTAFQACPQFRLQNIFGSASVFVNVRQHIICCLIFWKRQMDAGRKSIPKNYLISS